MIPSPFLLGLMWAPLFGIVHGQSSTSQAAATRPAGTSTSAAPAVTTPIYANLSFSAIPTLTACQTQT